MSWRWDPEGYRGRAFLRTPPSCRNIYPNMGRVGKRILKEVLEIFSATAGMADGRQNRPAAADTTRGLSDRRSPREFNPQQDKARRAAVAHYWAAFSWLLLIAAVAGCGGDPGERLQSGRVLALSGLQGRWVGSVLPMEPACGSATQGLMSIGGKGFGFDPFQSTTVIQGDVGTDGRMIGSLTRLGSDHQNLSITFEGGASGSDTISGTLQSGRCHWTVTMHRG
jgi:hypothetical protein